MKIRVKLQESVPVIVKLRELSVIKIKTAELMIYRLLRSKVGVGVGLNSAIVHLLGRIKTRLGVGIGTNGHANAKKRMQHIDFGVGTDMDADPTLSKKIEVQFGEGVGVRATGSSEKKIPEQKVGFGAGFNANVFYRELIDTRFGFGAAILRVQGVLMHKLASVLACVLGAAMSKRQCERFLALDPEWTLRFLVFGKLQRDGPGSARGFAVMQDKESCSPLFASVPDSE